MLFALLIVFLITGVRILYLYFYAFDLYADEAQYWLWSRTPDWGYYSKPPMVAWAIAATTSLCGDSEFCIRLSSPLMYGLTGLVMYALGVALFGTPQGRSKHMPLFAAVTFLTLPSVTLSTTLISTDSFLIFFWALAMLSFWKATETNQWRWWCLLGIACGLGLLSKYNFGFFGVSAVLYLLVTPEKRWHLLHNFRPYTAALLTALIFLPNLWWNLDHEFVSFLHTRDNAHLEKAALHPLKMLEFLAAQLAVFGPVLFVSLFVMSVYLIPPRLSIGLRPCFVCSPSRGERKSQNLYLLCMILPFFLTILTLSLLSRAHANWAAPVYVPATLLVVCMLWVSRWKKWLFVSLALHIIVAAGFYHYDRIIALTGVEMPDPFRRIRGWRMFGQQISERMSYYPNALLLTDERELAATISYYVRPTPPPLVKWNADGIMHDYFDMTTSMQGREGQDFLFITQYNLSETIAARFRGVTELAPLQQPGRSQHVYYLTHFKGYR